MRLRTSLLRSRWADKGKPFNGWSGFTTWIAATLAWAAIFIYGRSVLLRLYCAPPRRNKLRSFALTKTAKVSHALLLLLLPTKRRVPRSALREPLPDPVPTAEPGRRLSPFGKKIGALPQTPASHRASLPPFWPSAPKTSALCHCSFSQKMSPRAPFFGSPSLFASLSGLIRHTYKRTGAKCLR